MKNESVIRGLYDREWNREVLDETLQDLEAEITYDKCQAILGSLDTLRSYFTKYAESKRAEHLKEVRKEMERRAREAGVTLEELFVTKGKRGKGKTRSKGEVAFRNPDDPSQTWSGKGKRPGWLKAKLGQGMDLEDLKV
ncbi:MAG: H-NS histone family protein [Candidatus Competibacteraceae bacterium]|nr:H-NS histone family protein [Candidatus Competibacteraceae bacterium]